MTTTTSLKVSPDLRKRVNRLAKATGRTPHGVMVRAIEREVEREERLQDFVAEALEADRIIDAGSEVYAAKDVHEWLDKLARDKRTRRPKPWRE